MRHPVRRLRTTVTYLSVAFLGTERERRAYRRQVNRSHALVRSDPDSPVRHDAFDPRLQLWVAACLYRGALDVRTRLHGPVDGATADAIYRECRRLGTTLQVPEQMWPPDRAAFERYWAAALAGVRIDPPVRDYLDRLIGLDYLPRPVAAALGPVNRFLTAGFLPPPFREQMQLRWTERDQRAFALLIGLVWRRPAGSCRPRSPGSRSTPAWPISGCAADITRSRNGGPGRTVRAGQWRRHRSVLAW